ncbi:MAG: type II toxin-antitoxin system VapC family toxin [Bifidobacteriaceae bacterium]|nr:type II toxin-antitoxin system VapC family toxin [Bifidobacteriaceae bacterium]
MSLVLDAGSIFEYLRDSRTGRRVRELMADDPRSDVPHLAIIETVSALRTAVRTGRLGPNRAEEALGDLATFPARRWAADDLLGRIWELKDNITPYDAVYVALAEKLGATLVTTDTKLASAARTFSFVRVVVP